jgi:hypothetical protein
MGRHAKEIIREEKVDITPCQPGTQKGLKRGEKNHLVKNERHERVVNP